MCADGPCPLGVVAEGYQPKGSEDHFGEVNVYISSPQQGNDIAIVIAADIYGWKLPNNKRVADSLAEKGYLAVLPDLWRNDSWTSDKVGDGEDFKAAIQRWRENHPHDRILKDIDSCVKFVREKYSHIKKLGIIGFCAGGRQALCASSQGHFDVTVGFYSTRCTVDDVKAAKGAIFLAFAENDPVIPLESVEELRGALKERKDIPTQVKVYQGTGHGFAHRGNYEDEVVREAAMSAMKDMYGWFEQHLNK